MRIGGIRGEDTRRVEPRNNSGEAALPSRALVPITPSPAGPAPPHHHRQAPFLAQLIATRDRIPQTRERRRVEPAEALKAYQAMAALKY